MTRIIESEATGPAIIKKADIKGDIAICRCGLTDSSLGLCTGMHKHCKGEKEGSLYVYNKTDDGKLEQVELETETDEEYQCGGECEDCDCDEDDE